MSEDLDDCDHIVIDQEDKGAMVCKNCGYRFYVPMPIDARFFCEVGFAFTKWHSRCKPKHDS